MQAEDYLIKVSIDEQRLQYLETGRIIMDVAVSTAANGPGEIMHSECTPRGRHRIRAKIGAGTPVNTVFVGDNLPEFSTDLVTALSSLNMNDLSHYLKKVC